MIYCSSPAEQYRARRAEIVAALTRVLEGDQYVLGRQVDGFEAAFAGYIGAEFAVGVNSGTDALTLALRALDIGVGDEVITVSHTALATVAAVIATGATPVLVDIEPGSYTMDPERVRAAITPRTRALVPVHLYGQPADMETIMGVAAERGLAVVEDCAQATGAVYRGRRVGSIGDAGCFSFYPTKNLGAIGDGGAVVTSRREIAERVSRLRQYGWDERRETEEPGINSRLDELQAAILNVKLPDLDEDNRRRREIAAAYVDGLAGTPLRLPESREGSGHVYHLFVVRAPDEDSRDSLRKSLLEAGVVAGVHYPVPAHQHIGYAERCRIGPGGLGATTTAAGVVLSLPMYPELGWDQVDHVVEAVRSHLSTRTSVGNGRA